MVKIEHLHDRELVLQLLDTIIFCAKFSDGRLTSLVDKKDIGDWWPATILFNGEHWGFDHVDIDGSGHEAHYRADPLYDRREGAAIVPPFVTNAGGLNLLMETDDGFPEEVYFGGVTYTFEQSERREDGLWLGMYA